MDDKYTGKFMLVEPIDGPMTAREIVGLLRAGSAVESPVVSVVNSEGKSPIGLYVNTSPKRKWSAVTYEEAFQMYMLGEIADIIRKKE